MDGAKASVLRQHHITLPGQLQTGGQRAGPGRASPHGLLNVTLSMGGRIRQQSFEWCPRWRLSETLQDPLACLGDGIRSERTRPAKGRGCSISD
jgi:hypothetical protein